MLIITLKLTFVFLLALKKQRGEKRVHPLLLALQVGEQTRGKNRRRASNEVHALYKKFWSHFLVKIT